MADAIWLEPFVFVLLFTQKEDSPTRTFYSLLSKSKEIPEALIHSKPS
jgi:hypothetical protein